MRKRICIRQPKIRSLRVRTKSWTKAESDRFYNFPYAAVEEALSNAVYHRAYDEREPIEVRVENDRMEIVSFPGPDRSVTMESLKNYRVSSRRYRNRRIGDFLKELHLTESRSYFVTRLFVHEGFVKVAKIVGDSEGGSKTETSFETSLKRVLKQKDFKKLELVIIWLAKEDVISIQEVMKLTHKSRTTAWRYMQLLVECGAVEMMGNTNNVCYRKTQMKKGET